MRWAEPVFHVLAHLPVGAPGSLFDPAWIAFVAREAGPAEGRTLGEDLAILRRAIDRSTIVPVQRLAWLFEDVAQVRAVEGRTLAELAPEEVADPRLLPMLTAKPIVAVVEILRAAAELEIEIVQALPPVEPEPVTFDLEVAPALALAQVEHVRALRMRGRVVDDRIWVGEPCRRDGPSAAHVAWQAAHEATVAEISRLARAHGLAHDHDALEHAALVAMATRAVRAGRGEAHAEWCAHFAAVPPLAIDAVPNGWREIVASVLGF
jgi:hypothetical protein